ncbi:CRISPR-associated endonuclease Cas2 [Candidatus Giovannonibacteria bacterium]|nr:CRISPR-associated endonuclease Cas2 [Candidatus Giovannonibacteria bacterium]
MGLTRSPKQYFRIAKNIPKKWKEINRHELYRAVREFKNQRLIDFLERDDGTIQIIISEKGKRRALKYKLDEVEIKTPSKWDKKWRIVIFDIPEKRKKAREALRLKLRELGFKELQKSVFVHPYECRDEISFITEVFELRPYIRMILSDSITNDEELKLYFGLV